MSLRVIAMLVLVAAVIASAVGVVYARHESRRHFVELNLLTNERASNWSRRPGLKTIE